MILYVFAAFILTVLAIIGNEAKPIGAIVIFISGVAVGMEAYKIASKYTLEVKTESRNLCRLMLIGVLLLSASSIAVV